MIFANALPNRLLRTWPKWSGLFVLGEEYSIITNGDLSVTAAMPYCTSAWMPFSNSIHAEEAIVRFRNPLITLNAETEGSFACRYSPISCAVCSGPFLDMRRKGKTTNVRCPSNSFLVFCNCTCAAGTSCPYNAFNPLITDVTNFCSIFMIQMYFLCAKIRTIFNSIKKETLYASPFLKFYL